MGEYWVALSDHAYRDLDMIYNHIAKTVPESDIALGHIDEIEAAILGLSNMPHLCPERKVGAYTNHGYRQLYINNYTVFFRISW